MTDCQQLLFRQSVIEPASLPVNGLPRQSRAINRRRATWRYDQLYAPKRNRLGEGPTRRQLSAVVYFPSLQCLEKVAQIGKLSWMDAKVTPTLREMYTLRVGDWDSCSISVNQSLTTRKSIDRAPSVCLSYHDRMKQDFLPRGTTTLQITALSLQKVPSPLRRGEEAAADIELVGRRLPCRQRLTNDMSM